MTLSYTRYLCLNNNKLYQRKESKTVRPVSRSQGLSINSHHIINIIKYALIKQVLGSTASQLLHLLHVYSTPVCPMTALTKSLFYYKDKSHRTVCSRAISLWCLCALVHLSASGYHLPALIVGKALHICAGGSIGKLQKQTFEEKLSKKAM